MNRWEGLIKYITILVISLFIEYAVLGPIIQEFVELGLNNEITVGGLTAPVKELMNPTHLFLYRSMWYIIEMGGIFGTIWVSLII